MEVRDQVGGALRAVRKNAYDIVAIGRSKASRYFTPADKGGIAADSVEAPLLEDFGEFERPVEGAAVGVRGGEVDV